MWLRDFHVDGLRLDAVHALYDDRAVHLLEELSTEVDALRCRARATAVAGRGVGSQRPAHRHPARGRRARPPRAVGRRRPPRPARAAHRRDAGLLRGLRRAPGALAKVLARVFLHDGTCSSLPPVERTADLLDRAPHAGLAVRGVAADPRPGRQPCRR
ncbi:MAG: hypothetical protein WKF83_12435 [Nocardioidaceae bacterium]